jgi:hypothetical protein
MPHRNAARIGTPLALALLSLSLPAGALPLTISQIYGGGGNSGATYTHDFIEIFNAGTGPVSLAGLSLQYASATGTGNFGLNAAQLTVLPAVDLLPGQYFLLQEARGAGGSVPLPTPDVLDATPIFMSATGGKVALVNSTLGLGCNGGSTPCSPAQLALILDLVGYGSANFFETAATPNLSNRTAAFRVDGGCADTGNNAADFLVGAPSPRNSASPRNVCAVTPVPEPGTLGLVGIGLLGLGVRRRRAA